MRTLAIGDMHGCHRSLVALEAAARITPADLVITLGDHDDRGPDSRKVVEWLIRRHATGRLTALRGNHELMLLAARGFCWQVNERGQTREFWLGDRL